MDNEKSFNDGISVLEILLKKFFISYDISDEEAEKYFIMYPNDRARAFDYDRAVLPKVAARFPVLFSQDGEQAEQVGTLIVLLEDNARLIRYDAVSEEEKSKGELIKKKVSELDFNANYDGIVSFAEVFYMASNVRRYPSGTSEHERAYKLYTNAVEEYMNKLKGAAENTEEIPVEIVFEEPKKEESITIDVSELPSDFRPIVKTPPVEPVQNNNPVPPVEPQKTDDTSIAVEPIVPLEPTVNTTPENPVSNNIVVPPTASIINIEENVSVQAEAINIEIPKAESIDYYKFIERIDNGNSEKKTYDFDWQEDVLLNYADDKSLEIACDILERGQLALEFDQNMVSIKSILAGFCDRNETDEEYLAKCKENDKYRVAAKEGAWKTSTGKPISTVGCFNCKYQSCPKRLAAYVLYLKNNNLLKDKLEAREKFRNENETNNGFFLFNWKTDNGLKNIDDKTFDFANELVDKNLVRVSRNLNKDGYIRIEEIFSCKDIQVSNFDINKLNMSYDWEKPGTLNRKTDCEVDSLCASYSCRMPYCATVVAAYIYYLKKSGQEDKLKVERDFYLAHKEEIDANRKDEINQKLDAINEKKEEKLHDLKESYDGKVENLSLTINNIMQSSKTNFHCIIVGEDEEENNKFIDKIVQLIKNENDIKNVRRLPITHFAKLCYHTTDLRINSEEKLVYSDYEIEKDPTFKKDANNIKYRSGYTVNRRNVLEENAIYILEDVTEFIEDYHYYLAKYLDKKMVLNAIDMLADLSSKGYLIINAKQNEVDPFMTLDSRLKFVYQNNIINVPTYSLEDMFSDYIKALHPDLYAKLRENEEEYKKQFLDYVGLNKKFMPFSKAEIINYIASYANTRNELVFPPDMYKKENLDSIIGLASVKAKVKEFEKYMIFQLKAKANGIKLASTNMHMIFTGNPGTGKTTVARIMAKMLFDLGVVKENKLIEVERKDLIAEYTGQTATKTTEVINRAMGGVLFIDEAYSLASDRKSGFEAEAITTLIKAMEDYKDKFVVIFAGYKNEMKKFTDMNPGISSRIGYTFDFEDYSVDELVEIFDLKMKKSGFEIDESANVPLKRLCDYFTKRKDFGNGRFVDKVIQKTLMRHASSETATIDLITGDDIPSIEELTQSTVKNTGDVENALNKIVGMENLKKEILSFGTYISFVKEAEKQNVKLPDSNMHMIFTGNPGTGKTTVARIIAKMLFDMEVIHENKLVEVERKDLVASHVGQTAPKTAEVIERAMGGVLFIDEAYTLARNSSNDFGSEAVATLIKAMEDHKGEFIVIFAGYKKEMRDFLAINPGIASRIGYTFNFEDYSDEELAEMFKRKVASTGLVLEEDAIGKVKELMKYFYKVENIGNGRFVDKVFAKTLVNRSKNYQQQIKNLEDGSMINASDVITITAEDIPTIQDITKTMLEGNSMIDPSKITPEDLKKTAIHEVGHATVGYLLSNKFHIKKITCKAEGMGALGYVEFDASGEGYVKSKEELLNEIKRLLAGIAAEEVFLGVYKNGGTSDLKKATGIARDMITRYGMSDLGLAHIFSNNADLEKMIYDEENKILSKCFEEVKVLISENRLKMSKVVDYLLERGEINDEEFTKVFNTEFNQLAKLNINSDENA